MSNGVAADGRGPRRDNSQGCPLPIGHKQRNVGGFNAKFMTELFGKVLHQCGRTDHLVSMEMFPPQLPAQIWSKYGGEKNLRIEYQPHEMSLNTSSSE